MLKKVALFIFCILTLSLINITSDNNRRCPNCCLKKPDKECCDEMPGLSICNPGNPGGDAADDNFCFSNGTSNRFYFITPDILINKRGYYQPYLNPTFGKQENAITDLEDSGDTLFKSGRILIIPTGALFSSKNSTTFKNILSQYVSQGGTIIVFDQQYGSHIDDIVPIPEGVSLKSYGWREDQSCLRHSCYYSGNHPVVSSSTSERVNVGIDGYFDQYPSNSTVLFSRSYVNTCSLFVLCWKIEDFNKKNGAEGDRTLDLLNAIQTRSQLRHSPI